MNNFQQPQSSTRASVEFRVTYLTGHGSAVHTELFDDEAAAERFAARQVLLEHEWAVIDAVPVPLQARSAA
ncbi:hypothetical protein IV498_13310 [Paenarthrobacter sp. Z7-10]|uniref:hypothetical protein n=1 Tax=Paenarthrobacter sp. Z7-10 TaxID=2787635 RepID=UPI0022A9DFFC|nr:hypothetical protein [Paenarthrobacter sp. Z7-10]MCZ2404131.1 hypothetical protein [Paenarthrobacter sp. Z7-10]